MMSSSLEHSNPVFSPDTLACGDVPSNWFGYKRTSSSKDEADMKN